MITASSTSILKKLLVLFLVSAGLYYAKYFLIPLAIGTVLATLFLPFCKWMEGKKLQRGLAVSICLLVLLLLIAGVFFLLGWQISELGKELELIKQKFVDTGNTIKEFIFQKMDVSIEKQEQMLKNQQPLFGSRLKSMASSLPSIFTNFILVLVYILFLLYYRTHIKQFLLKLSPLSENKEMEKVIYRVAHVSQEYLLGLSKMIACLWIMYGIGFSIIGIKHALFFAFLCGLLEIIPFIGNITGTTITLLVAAVHGATVPMLLGIAGT
ncbi:MAG TPA: AI-2E family transporter, partial [Bacteroidia bacterium]|nr:AI-2E family transporter [Bacteroidia bacterium]